MVLCCNLRLFVGMHITNLHVAKNRSDVCLLQLKICCARMHVVISATNNLNLQHSIAVQHVTWKCCFYYLAFSKA